MNGKSEKIIRVDMRRPTKSRPYHQLRFYSAKQRAPVKYRTLKCKSEVAEEILKQLRDDIEQGTFKLADAVPGIADGNTFGDFAEAYIKYRIGLTAGNAPSLAVRTVEKDDEALKMLHKIIGSDVTMSQIDEYTAQYFIEQMQERHNQYGRPFSTSYINILIRHLSSAFNWAVAAGYLRENPFRGAQIKQRSKGVVELPRYLTNDEIAIVRERAAMKGKPRHWLWIVNFALWTGMRREEILNANRNNIFTDTIDGQKRHFLRVTGKGSKTRIVPLPSQVMALIAEIKELTDNLMELDAYIHKAVHSPDRSANYERASMGYLFFMVRRPDVFSKMFRRIIKGTGIDANFHSLRHTFATKFLENGGDLKTLSTILGHSSVTTTEIYAKVTAKKMSADIERLTAI